MNSSLEAELARATALTFEGLAFVFPSPELLDDQRQAPFEAAVAIEFEGTFGGQLTLAVSGGVLPAIVSNMLGADLGSDPTARKDALGELANVICGNVLTHVAGGDKSFLLSAPRPLSKDQFDALRVPGLTRIEVGIEGGGPRWRSP